MTAFAVFLVGALIGSFLNVCIYRIPKNMSVVLPRSHCPACGHNIDWYYNMPIVSYAALAGRCAYCKAKISVRYPLVEIITASLLTALFLVFGITTKFFSYSIMTCGLIIATFMDFEVREIPDQVSLGGIVAGIAIAFLFPSVFDLMNRRQALFDSAVGTIVGGGSMLALKVFGTIIFSKKVKELGIGSAMGDGDVKLIAMIGSFLGWRLVLLTFFVAPFLGSVAGMISKMRSGSNVIPYGPYLSLAAMIAVFFGDRLLRTIFQL